jgi:hypothetical protein
MEVEQIKTAGKARPLLAGPTPGEDVETMIKRVDATAGATSVQGWFETLAELAQVNIRSTPRPPVGG